MYKVYIELNSDNDITSINSELFLSQEEKANMNLIDEGEGDKYVHAQGQYLDKGLIDRHGRYNYKFTEGKLVEISEDEKPEITKQKAVPTEQDRINAQLMLQIAQLKAQMNGVK